MVAAAPADVRPHVDALMALVEAGTPAALNGYRGEGPDYPAAAAPYWVLFTDPGTPEPGNLGARFDDLLVEFQITAVGTTSEQAEWAADTVRRALLTGTPIIPGRVPHPVVQVQAPPRVLRDDDVQPPVFYLPVVYQLRTTPA